MEKIEFIRLHLHQLILIWTSFILGDPLTQIKNTFLKYKNKTTLTIYVLKYTTHLIIIVILFLLLLEIRHLLIKVQYPPHSPS